MELARWSGSSYQTYELEVVMAPINANIMVCLLDAQVLLVNLKSIQAQRVWQCKLGNLQLMSFAGHVEDKVNVISYRYLSSCKTSLVYR